MANEPAERGHLAQRAVEQHVGRVADPPGAGVEGAVLRDSRGSRPSRPDAARQAAAALRAARARDSTATSLRPVDHERTRRGAPPARMPRAPATTCAAVTTTCGRATHPDPSTPRPHAVARIATTLGRARRTPADARTRRFGGTIGGAGPAICWNGSIRAKRAQEVARRHELVQRGAGSSTAGVAAQGRLARELEQDGTGDPDERRARAAAPATSPPTESSSRSGGTTDSRRARTSRRARRPPGAPSRRRARRPSAASGVYGDFDPPCRKCGASRAPTTAPATSPPRESTVAIRPRLRPEQRRDRDRRQRDPVDARHASRFSRASTLPAAATLRREPGA